MFIPNIRTFRLSFSCVPYRHFENYTWKAVRPRVHKYQLRNYLNVSAPFDVVCRNSILTAVERVSLRFTELAWPDISPISHEVYRWQLPATAERCRFKCRHRGRLLLLRCATAILSPSRQILGLFLSSVQRHFLSYTKKAPRPESASELYPPSNRHLSTKLVPTLCG
jgi:hypothetical protein